MKESEYMEMVYTGKLLFEKKIFDFSNSGCLYTESNRLKLFSVKLKRPIGPYLTGEKFDHIIIDYKNETVEFFKEKLKEPVYQAVIQLEVFAPNAGSTGYMP